MKAVDQVEAQPYQRHQHQQHPATGENGCGQGFAAAEPARQQAHQRPAGEGQDRPPQQCRSERQHHPQARAEQRQQNDLYQ